MTRWNLTSAGVFAVFFALGCQGDVGGAPLVPDPAQLYAELRLNHEAVVLSMDAPYDTVQLRAVPISLTGDTLPYDSTITFFRPAVLDTSVRVDSFSGMVTSHVKTDRTLVIARLRIGSVTRTDTVVIMVRDDDPIRPIARMEFSPLPPDSNWRWAGERNTVQYDSWVRFFDDSDDPIPTSQALYHFSVQKPAVFFGTKSQYINAAALLGETYAYANVYAYGKYLRDSTLFRRIDPPIRLVLIDRIVPVNGSPTIVFLPARTEAKVGTTIVFYNRFGINESDEFGDFGFCLSGICGNRIKRVTETPNETLIWVDSVDIEFDQPSLVSIGDSYGYADFGNLTLAPVSDGGAGNIPAFSLVACIDKNFTDELVCEKDQSDPTAYLVDNGMRTRKFNVPGTYHYLSTRFPGVRGVIVIKE